MVMSLSLRERGLKSCGLCKVPERHLSLSLRERGLKYRNMGIYAIHLQSLSLRERGLKSNQKRTFVLSSLVALLARAWIEISIV